MNSIKRNESNNRLNILHNIISNNINAENKASLENQISNDLDNYLRYNVEDLMNLPIETLYNIFNKSHNLTLHNEAYKSITNKNQSQEKYILLKFLDAKRLKQEYINESIEMYEQRNFFVPKNTFSMWLNKSHKKMMSIAFFFFSFIFLFCLFITYHLYSTIQNKDNTINSLYQIIKDNSDHSEIIENKLKNQTELFQNQRKLIIGSLFFSTRNEDRLPGALKCNGQTVNVNEFPQFVDQYLKTNLVATISLQSWEQQKNTNNNVGFFGYDQNGGIFKTPFIPSGSYLSNANVDKVDGNQVKQGNYHQDQIVNMLGEFNFDDGGQGHPEVWHANGVFNKCCPRSITYPSPAKYIPNNTPRGVNFNASRVVKTGDRVMPRTIFYNLYVVIFE